MLIFIRHVSLLFLVAKIYVLKISHTQHKLQGETDNMLRLIKPSLGLA